MGEYSDRLVVLVLVLVLIKDPPTIKSMLSLRYPYTRDLFVHQSLQAQCIDVMDSRSR